MQTRAFFTPAPSRSAQAQIRLLEAALRIFGEKGPEGATVREIATAAGQNVAAIAYYFGSKEELYFAVIEAILRELRQHLAEVLEEIAALRQRGGNSPSEALRLLKQLLGAVYARLLSRKEAVPMAQLVVREQLVPTEAFDLLYEKGFRELHEALCFLVGMALGRNPVDTETILRTHTIMGQVYFFAMSREAILRRLGWKALDGANSELVLGILDENLNALISGLRKSKPRKRQP
jgi:TetR/AcrR family transcriptional regulator, regulator of cefoperazone and chloramphenicol sensitivity